MRRDEHLGSKLLSMGIQNSDHHIAQIITFPKIPDMPMAMSTRYVFGEILNLKKKKKKKKKSCTSETIIHLRVAWLGSIQVSKADDIPEAGPGGGVVHNG